VALCLVLTHLAINCVSSAAVCVGQIGSSATGPSASLHWDELPDLLVPTDPNQRLSLLLCVRPSVSRSSPVSLFFFSVALGVPPSVLSLLGDGETSQPNQREAFLHMLPTFKEGAYVTYVLRAVLTPPPSRSLVSARKGHKRLILCLYVRGGTSVMRERREIIRGGRRGGIM